jgi:hypothetical protein
MSKLSDRFEKETGEKLLFDINDKSLGNWRRVNLHYIEWLEKLSEKEIVYPSDEEIEDNLELTQFCKGFFAGVKWTINKIKELNK